MRSILIIVDGLPISVCARLRGRRGFTLIELLVTIGIIGILIALLLPAVHAAREAARKTTCRNHLRQLALGVVQHEGIFRSYPSNGWGWRWMADPDRGSGIQQPGGWIYQTLPFIEQSALHEVGRGDSPGIKRLKLADLTSHSLSIVRCPSRPATILVNRDPAIEWRNAEPSLWMARSDYVANGGEVFPGLFDGPETLTQGDSRSFAWPSPHRYNGVIYLRSKTSSRDVTDGLTQTLLLGEKYVAQPFYNHYGDKGYDQSYLAGDDWDLVRWTEKPPLRDGHMLDPERFGSVHAGGYHVAFCDGSVRVITYTIDAIVHRYMGNRQDGQVIEIP